MQAPMEPGIICSDIDRMIAFYTEVLGFAVASDAETIPELSTRFGATPAGYRIVRLNAPIGKLKLIQPGQAPEPSARPEWVFGQRGISYITFVVSDLNEVLERLKQHGVRFVSPEPVEVRPGVLAIFTLDPEDNFVEFVAAP